ncbi:right-handed parallel beta-helix repeat-containing protein [Candidatus Sumerlaeota bacterium]|nr:right-handed parallel beta-helix repeat-containing protein [Candidatus Sumerlaeota bacterium]
MKNRKMPGKPIASIVLCVLLACASFLASATDYQGVGFTTPAGSGGRVIQVANLASSVPGSLRAALDETGPRIVVFEVGGVIDLGGRSLSIREPYLTLAGQTAPAPGITLIRGGLKIETHDIVVQHIRVRPGDAAPPGAGGWEPDGIGIGRGRRVIVDHCSVSWSVDENISASGPRTEGPEATSSDVTIRDCINAEGLSHATHGKKEHSKGTLVHDYCRNISIVRNLYAHNVDRNPLFKGLTTGIVVNNVIYNPGRRAVGMGWVDEEWPPERLPIENGRIAVVGNVLIHGPDTRRTVPLVYASQGRGDAYLDDNLVFLRDGSAGHVTTGSLTVLPNEPIWDERLEVLPASETAEYVIRHAGARPQQRDPIDQRIVDDFLARRGRIVDSQNDVGGYPQYRTTSRPLKAPETGVDEWLAQVAAELE